MQCAWWRRLYDDAGTIGDSQPILLPRMTHGVCHARAGRILREEAARHGAAGDIPLALRLERERLVLQWTWHASVAWPAPAGSKSALDGLTRLWLALETSWRTKSTG